MSCPACILLEEVSTPKGRTVAHQSLYRKYRPQTFDDVVGQQHIERTIRNAVAEGSVSHAYLFTGPRGTGKTTTARLLAKALNCEKGPDGEPDGTCEQCIEIADGRHPDVYELDAASRTGVDNVREEIIGRVQFAPTKGRYKVYIIDEVHMLSVAAFNALLKTLEEPPSHVVFILATTHPHKVPDTIHSRCQRFDFHRISIDEIVGRLRVICDGEGFEVPDPALALIARHAAGGMRDAITTLEQLAAFTSGKIGLADVEGLLGEVDSAELYEVAKLVARRDIASCFRWVARFAESGTDLAEFVRELTQHVRNLYLLAAVGDGVGIVDATSEELGLLSAQAAEFGGPDRLARVLDLLGELAGELRWSSDQRLSLEVALTRMARPTGEMTLQALAERIESLERGVSSAAPPRSISAAPAPSLAPQSAVSPSPASAVVPEASAPAPAPAAAAPKPAVDGPKPAAPAPAAPVAARADGAIDRAAAKRAWPAVLVEIKKLKPARASQYSHVELEVDADGKTLVLEFASDQSFVMNMAEEPDMREMLTRALAAVFGTSPPVRMQLGRGSVRPPAQSAPNAPTAAARATAAPSWDDEPMPEYYETGAGTSEDAAPHHAAQPAPAKRKSSLNQVVPSTMSGAAPASDLERLLVNDLGAQIVAEHTAALDSETADETAASEDGSFAALAETTDAGRLDPGLFDPDSGEDDQ